MTLAPETVHTGDVVEEKLTEPVEDEVAETVREPVPIASSVSDPNVMVCGRNAVATVADATAVFVVTPLPSLPLELLPQHQRVVAEMAHVASLPVFSPTAEDTPSTVSGPWLAGVPLEPLPI